MSCFYTNTLRADFGRTITFEALNEQFEAIEAAWACLDALVSTVAFSTENTYNNGTVDTEYVLTPGNGTIQYVTVLGDVELEFSEPNVEDSNLITLVVANGGDGVGGDGRFNFPAGTAWTTDSNGTTMDGLPWDNEGLAGDYGAIVTCIYDGFGWIYMVFARNNIDFTAAADVADLFNWR